jgi:hypothetical protein
MTTQPGEPEKHSRDSCIAKPPISPKRPEQKQEHKGRQQQTTQDFRPERQAEHSGKRVDKSAEKGGQPRHA